MQQLLVVLLPQRKVQQHLPRRFGCSRKKMLQVLRQTVVQPLPNHPHGLGQHDGSLPS